MACPERFADMAYALAELPGDLSTMEAATACVEEVSDLSAMVGIPHQPAPTRGARGLGARHGRESHDRGPAHRQQPPPGQRR